MKTQIKEHIQQNYLTKNTKNINVLTKTITYIAKRNKLAKPHLPTTKEIREAIPELKERKTNEVSALLGNYMNKGLLDNAGNSNTKRWYVSDTKLLNMIKSDKIKIVKDDNIVTNKIVTEKYKLKIDNTELIFYSLDELNKLKDKLNMNYEVIKVTETLTTKEEIIQL
jgi:hypothetical protein